MFFRVSKSQKQIIYPWQTEKWVWNEVFNGEKQVSIGGGVTTRNIPNLFSKVTRLLLMLVITLSVTMILYNWIKYIVETWQWKDSKSLMKNVAYIIIWILVSLFSIIIITLLRSVPTTIESDVEKSVDNETDNNEIEGPEKPFKFSDLFNSI